jgi:urease accessory protein
MSVPRPVDLSCSFLRNGILFPIELAHRPDSLQPNIAREAPLRIPYAAGAAITIAGPAFAHADPSVHGSAFAGLAHPFLGADHLLAMVAVGVLAATQGRAALWALPAAFVGGMAGGIALGALGVALPFVEPVILASILALAALVVSSARLPVALGATMIAAFGLAHGSAHGLEMGSAAALPFALGVLGATAVLHAAGVGLGMVLMRHGPALRLLGAGLGLGALGSALS